MLKKLASYTAYMLLATSLVKLFAIAVTLLGAGLREQEDFGDHGTYILIYEIIMSALTMGVNQTIQKYAAADDDNRKRFTVLLYRGFLVLLVLGAAAALPVGWYWKWSMALAFIGVPWVVASTLGRFIVRSQLDARVEARLVVVGSFTNSLFTLAFLVLTDFKDALIYGDFASLVVTGLVTLFVLPGAAAIQFKDVLTLKIPRDFLAECARFTAPIWGAGAVGTSGHYASGGYTRVALGTAPMGILGFGKQLWQFAFVPMELVGQAALPALVKETEERPRMFRELLRLCLIAFPFIAIGVATGMPLLLQVLTLDEKWHQVPDVLLLLVLSVPLRSFQIVANHYTIAEGHARLAFYTAIVYVVAIGIALYPLSQVYGIYGIIIAEVIASTANACSFAVFMWKGYRNDMRTGMIQSWLAMLACVTAMVPVWILRDWPWRWTLALPCGLAYLMLLFIFRVAHRTDITRLVNALRERFGRGLTA